MKNNILTTIPEVLFSFHFSGKQEMKNNILTTILDVLFSYHFSGNKR